jgi:hypothetical protein
MDYGRGGDSCLTLIAILSAILLLLLENVIEWMACKRLGIVYF